ncbi:MAG TPA: alanine racemase [Jatrophihabitans sp.]|nr:alanine racemase [Jatrophihabitans sp.]
MDLDAVRDNVGLLRERAGSAAVMAVVKADAYGHGLLPCARAALAGGASWLGVAQLSEALAVRAAGIEAPLLAWLTVPGDAYPAAVAAGIDIGVSTDWALAEVAAAAESAGVVAQVHLKVDTGLNRNGAALEDWPDLVEAGLKLQAEGLIRLFGVFSHFAYADDPVHPTVQEQTSHFVAAVQLAEQRGARFEVRHLANSAATLTNPATHFDLVRPGIAVYGLSPIPELSTAAELGLRPAMTLLSRVANVKRVPAGQGVSYGHTYVTSRPTTVALLPIGYADGLPRHAGNKGPVQLAGQRHQVAGRVCMDQVVIDLANQPDGADPDVAAALADVHPGDVALLFGSAPGQPSAQDWAEAAGTISYEVVSRIGSRVPKIYTGTAGTAPIGTAGTAPIGTAGREADHG